MDLVIDPAGCVRAVYSEEIDLAAMGPIRVTRASHVEPTPDGRWTADRVPAPHFEQVCAVEPTPDGRWTADLAPTRGPVLGPFGLRSAALAAEHAWLAQNWLHPRG